MPYLWIPFTVEAGNYDDVLRNDAVEDCIWKTSEKGAGDVLPDNRETF